MFPTFKSLVSHFLHLIYPHNCEGCGTDTLNADSFLCAKCLYQLPETGFISAANNPLEKKFYGRLKLENAAAGFYFTKDSLLQHLIAQLKYKNNQDMGLYLGKLVGYQLLSTDRFDSVEALIPVPLNPKKEHKRGYNQSQLICEGIASVWKRPIISDAVRRIVYTETQTNKNISDRWDNVDGAFAIADDSSIKGKHIALIDDVITTGASIESCGSELLKIEGLKLSVLSVGFTL
jgi:ComF family protein